MSVGTWISVRVGDLGRIVTGRTPPSSRPACFGQEYPFITPSDMDGRRYIHRTERYLSEEGAQLLASCAVPKNSVCVSCIGWQLGKVVLATAASFTNQQINSIIPSEIVDPLFLYYSLSTRRDEIRRLGSSGARTPILHKSEFSRMDCELPSLKTQRQIASILSAYDDLIENNTRRIAILEEMARVLYQEWFVHFRFPGHEHVPFAPSPLGPIPEGWEPRVLGDVAQDHRRGVQPDALDADTPCVGLEHIPRRSIALSEWGKALDVQSTKLRFRKGEILFGKIRPYFHKVSVARIDGVCSSDAIVISAKRADWWAMVLMCVSSDQFVAHSVQTSNGTKMPRANWDVLLKYGTPIPPDELLDHFNRFVRAAVDQMHVLIFKNRNLRTTRDLLLPKLISGEIDVSAMSEEPIAEAAD